MNWLRRIIFLLNLKDVKPRENEEDNLETLAILEFNDMFNQIISDMLNLQAALTEKGLSPTCTISGNHQAELTLDGDCIVGIQVNFTNRTLTIYSAQGKQVFNQDEAINKRFIDEKLYEHSMGLLKEKIY